MQRENTGGKEGERKGARSSQTAPRAQVQRRGGGGVFKNCRNSSLRVREVWLGVANVPPRTRSSVWIYSVTARLLRKVLVGKVLSEGRGSRGTPPGG